MARGYNLPAVVATGTVAIVLTGLVLLCTLRRYCCSKLDVGVADSPSEVEAGYAAQAISADVNLGPCIALSRFTEIWDDERNEEEQLDEVALRSPDRRNGKLLKAR